MHFVIGAIAHEYAAFGQGTGHIYIGEVECSGSEPSLFACDYIYNPFCRHSADVGVTCSTEG